MGNAHPEHLWQAPGGTWYLNIGVPKKYREAVGRKTYMKSLRTKDRDEAKHRKHAAMVAAQDYFKRRQSGRPITIEEIDHPACTWYSGSCGGTVPYHIRS